LCAVENVSDALQTLRAFENRFAGGLLVFEGMWREFMKIATERVGLLAPFEKEHEILLLVEVAAGDGSGAAERFEACLAELFEAGLVKDAVIAQSGQDRDRLWAYRESPYEYRRFMPKLIGFDVSIPRFSLGDAVEAIRNDIADRWPEATHVYFGHIADSNLHVIVTAPGFDEMAKHEIEDALYERVAAFNGSVSAEHGIGRNKRPYLRLSRTAPELALMGMIKSALDPAGILNPRRVL
jgi:FAD/FMN-containing dehydrogenase